MPTLNFPVNPTLNQVYSFENKTWIWNGQGWRLNPSGAINNIPIGNTDPSTGAFTTISATGNITGNYFIGNGSQLTGLAATYGNSNVVAYGQAGWAGNIVPSGNAVYSLGNATNQWNDLYVSNATIYMNNVPLSLTAGNVLTINGEAILSNDSNIPITTTANITAEYFIGNGSQLTGINGMSSGIQNGNSNVQVYANSNVAISSNGVSNVMVVTSQDVTITGNLTVTGNATLSGNILGDRIQNGNTSFDIQTSNGNANISVGGVSNVAVFTPSGVVVNGNITATAYQGNGTALIGVLSDRGSDTNNWDTLTEMGVYLVNRLSWSGTSGTPLDSQVFVGLLEVQTSQVQTTTQIFYPGQVDATDIKIQWNRALWGSTWTPWVKMTNDGQLISGGEF